MGLPPAGAIRSGGPRKSTAGQDRPWHTVSSHGWASQPCRTPYLDPYGSQPYTGRNIACGAVG